MSLLSTECKCKTPFFNAWNSNFIRNMHLLIHHKLTISRTFFFLKATEQKSLIFLLLIFFHFLRAWMLLLFIGNKPKLAC
uniref:Uncharacterized protein n=1 Tax=Lepeophtheirus salmonis TaxID=72036 RepID=A0A0K2ULT2_LEPSM